MAASLNDTGDNPDPLRNAGWYLNLPGNGERVVSDVMIRDVCIAGFVTEAKET